MYINMKVKKSGLNSVKIVHEISGYEMPKKFVVPMMEESCLPLQAQMLLITPPFISTINHDSKEKKPRAQQAWSWSRHAREVITLRMRSNSRTKTAKRALEINNDNKFLVKNRCASTAKAIPKDKAIKRFLVR